MSRLPAGDGSAPPARAGNTHDHRQHRPGLRRCLRQHAVRGHERLRQHHTAGGGRAGFCCPCCGCPVPRARGRAADYQDHLLHASSEQCLRLRALVSLKHALWKLYYEIMKDKSEKQGVQNG